MKHSRELKRPEARPADPALAGLTRRALLSRAVAAGALMVAGAGFIAAPDAAWALEVTVITPEQMAALKQTGCDQLQGYFFGRPMSESAICDLIAPPEDRQSIAG